VSAPDDFVPLARALRAPSPAGGTEPPPSPPAPPETPPDVTAALREARLFRAHLADALESARDLLLRELACAVLGRELTLAPADLTRLTQAVLAAHPTRDALAVRVHPADVGGLELSLPVRGDARLAPGDLVLELGDGTCVDARLGVRLATALAVWS
jgi:hypothetical protein